MDRDFDDYEPWGRDDSCRLAGCNHPFGAPHWPKDSWSIPDELAAMRRAIDFAGIFAGVAVLALFFAGLWVWSVIG